MRGGRQSFGKEVSAPRFSFARGLGLGGYRIANGAGSRHKQKEGASLLTNLKVHFKNNPLLFYAMSIAATWANAGSRTHT